MHCIETLTDSYFVADIGAWSEQETSKVTRWGKLLCYFKIKQNGKTSIEYTFLLSLHPILFKTITKTKTDIQQMITNFPVVKELHFLELCFFISKDILRSRPILRVPFDSIIFSISYNRFQTSTLQCLINDPLLLNIKNFYQKVAK